MKMKAKDLIRYISTTVALNGNADMELCVSDGAGGYVAVEDFWLRYDKTTNKIILEDTQLSEEVNEDPKPLNVNEALRFMDVKPHKQLFDEKNDIRFWGRSYCICVEYFKETAPGISRPWHREEISYDDFVKKFANSTFYII